MMLRNISKYIEKPLEECKRHLFSEALTQNFSPYQRLRILEVGVGTGTNFKYYPANAMVTLLDCTKEYLPRLNERFIESNRFDLVIEKIIIASIEDMRVIPSNEYDIVLGTLVLCSVDMVDRALQEIKRVLKPGGIYMFIEHSKDMAHGMRNFAQTLVSPLWTQLLRGCRFQDLIKIFKETQGFSKLQIYYYQNIKHNLLFILTQPIYYGFFKK